MNIAKDWVFDILELYLNNYTSKFYAMSHE